MMDWMQSLSLCLEIVMTFFRTYWDRFGHNIVWFVLMYVEQGNKRAVATKYVLCMKKHCLVSCMYKLAIFL